LFATAAGADEKKTYDMKEHGLKKSFIQVGTFKELDFAPIPHDDDYVLDLHRPYIDEITYEKGGKKFSRIPEVFDTWFDSGAMPYAVPHYPFEDNINPNGGFMKNGKLFDKQRGFPADFIAEGLDQTRGWFYTLLALNTALFGQSPYKNVIVNGLVLAEDGQKMSKRLNNYPPLDSVFNKYGADAMRYYMLSSPIVEAEPLAFSEKGVDEVYKKIISRLLNVVSFYEMYRPENFNPNRNSKNILDRWIVARLDEVINQATNRMDEYKLAPATRPINDFVDDLSTWYVRRSRDRFKGDDQEDKTAALETTQYILAEFSKVLAPFMPFLAEEIYQRVTNLGFSDENNSVHLQDWPKVEKPDTAVLDEMRAVRGVVSLGLLARDQAGIKVRQPLQSLKTIEDVVTMDPYSRELIRDELNIKEVIFDSAIGIEGGGANGEKKQVELNTVITEDLKEEGVARELIRFIQTLRKQKRLNPEDGIMLTIGTDSTGEKIIERFKSEISETVRADHLEVRENDGEELVAEDISFKVSIG
jgi:isoleucyl-tRNA synthetase